MKNNAGCENVRGVGCRLVLGVLLLLFLVPAGVVEAKIYKWRDAEGKLHFSDSPDNVPAEVLNDFSKEYRPDNSRMNLVPASPQTPVASQAVPDAAGTGGAVSIPYISREGSASRVIVNVTFNGNERARIMVDTGSPGLVLSGRLAARLGLLDSDGSNLMVVISGIGGQQSALRTIVDSLALGGISEKFIPAHIVSGMAEAYEGLIGMDILSGYQLTIDPANQRLLAKAVATAQQLPAGRDRNWWQRNYREFRYYHQFWQQQAELVSRSDSAYARMATSKRDRIERFILRQRDEAGKLYDRLERFARWNSVPRHWRN